MKLGHLLTQSTKKKKKKKTQNGLKTKGKTGYYRTQSKMWNAL